MNFCWTIEGTTPKNLKSFIFSYCFITRNISYVFNQVCLSLIHSLGYSGLKVNLLISTSFNFLTIS